MKKIDKIMNLLFSIYFFLTPYILWCAIELLRYETKTPMGENAFHIVFLSYVFILAGQCLFTGLTFNSFVGVIINSIVFYLLGFTSQIMSVITGDPLLPTDLLLAEQVKSISSFVNFEVDNIMIKSIVILICNIIIFYFLRRYGKPKYNFKVKAIISGVLVLFFCISSYYMCYSYWFRREYMLSKNITISAFNPVSEYNNFGVVLTFFPRIGDIKVKKPEAYNQEKINQIKSNHSLEHAQQEEVIKKPNIIAIQNEAWWDPTRLSNTTFTTDPMPNTRKLLKKYPGGELITPVFGGGTCIPEFEFLTGLSSYFLPVNSYPYIQHVTKETTSLASVFKDNDYQTVALHTYKKNFYSRNKAYPLMGFDSFIGDEDLIEPEIKGGYISDMEMARQIIKLFETKTSDRFFSFNVSMQNHGEHSGGRYEEYSLDVQNDLLSANDLAGLRDNAQGVYDADASLKYLIDYFSNIKEPTIIVMYGDHMPFLGQESSTYKDSQFVNSDLEINITNTPQLYKTPYIVWANYNISFYDFPKEITPSDLGMKVLDMAELDNVPWFYSVINDFYDYSKSKGNKIEVPTFEEEMLLQDYYLLQYDILHGNQYSNYME